MLSYFCCFCRPVHLRVVCYCFHKCKLMEPRIGTGYTFSKQSEFHGFFRDPLALKMADLNSLPVFYREVEMVL